MDKLLDIEFETERDSVVDGVTEREKENERENELNDADLENDEVGVEVTDADKETVCDCERDNEPDRVPETENVNE
jgi:hypothetical protein